MQGRTTVLGLAAVLTLTLTSCGVRSEADRGRRTGGCGATPGGAGHGPERPDHAGGRELLRRNRRRGGPRPARAWSEVGKAGPRPAGRLGPFDERNGRGCGPDRTGRETGGPGRQGCGGGRWAGPEGGKPGSDRKVTCAGSGCSSAFEPAACQGAGGWLKSTPEGRFVQKTRLPARYFSSLSHLAKWGLYEYD